jgi:SagB-type dehydrogenase family enzyme
MRITVFATCFFLLTSEAAMARLKVVQLPERVAKKEFSLDEAIAKRRSERHFVKKDLDLSQVSSLLWAAQGITDSSNLRTAPSAGALYPMELYLLSKDGLFHYLPEGHKLESLSEIDLREALTASALGQSSVAQAAIDIVICAVFSRTTGKYGRRGERYVYIEAGHIAQNIHLEAVALGLGSVPIGAFSDEQVKKVLSLPDNCQPLYIIPVGYPSG